MVQLRTEVTAAELAGPPGVEGLGPHVGAEHATHLAGHARVDRICPEPEASRKQPVGAEQPQFGLSSRLCRVRCWSVGQRTSVGCWSRNANVGAQLSSARSARAAAIVVLQSPGTTLKRSRESGYFGLLGGVKVRRLGVDALLDIYGQIRQCRWSLHTEAKFVLLRTGTCRA